MTGAFVLTGRMPIGTGLVELVAQLGGASLAAFFLAAAFPEAVRKVAAILTFFLVFAVFGTAVDGHGPRMGGLLIGLALTMAILVGGALAGWIYHAVFTPS